ncbi:MAG TPA: tRNA (adenosine(37)-N6)-threonylcarbamoyltransferase complex dimerization subunit type 1 TsaB [Nitrospirota bacterium]|nr:tRNA (adenosine(37)-N6)-threonylcarbamoyltransferase complex dimerization subunit type 1 TsaB [Nitrospirota bacterium]
MIILGIETATRTGSVAVVNDSGVIAEYTLNIELTHSERLMSTVDRVLSDTGIKVADLNGFAVSIGPGSFTGLRIGLAAVKGLALATNKPVTAVSTLKGLAWNLPYSRYPVCPLLDARKKEVYAAIYRFGENGLVQEMEESVLSLGELAGRVKERTIFTGEGSHLFQDGIRSLFGERAVFAPASAMAPSAASIAGIGMMQLNDGDRADPDSLTPQYIRRPEAEVAWEKRTGSR